MNANWVPSYARPITGVETSSASTSGARRAPDPRLLALVELLADRNQAAAKVDPRAPVNFDTARVLKLVSKQGVRFSNVNRGPPSQLVMPAEMSRQLDSRRGAVFSTLAHIGRLYQELGRGFPKNSEFLAVSVYEDSALVTLGSYYVLKFADEEGEYRLVECDYLQEERE